MDRFGFVCSSAGLFVDWAVWLSSLFWFGLFLFLCLLCLFDFPMCLFLSWLAWLFVSWFVNSFLALLGCFLFGMFSLGFYL